MPDARYHTQAVTSLFRQTLSPQAIERIARRTGLVRRRRVVTGAGLFWALILTLGAQKAEYVSDVLRTMNAWQGSSVRYKPFWNRLATQAFVRFTKVLFQKLCQELVTRMLRRQRGSSASFFSEIFIDDGSSFAVADGLRKVFPGRFTKIKPAAVEVHTRMSVLSDQVLSVTLAPDKEGERQFLPAPEKLPRRSLSLRDRGYIDIDYFERLCTQDAYLICRSRQDLNPTIFEVLSGLPQRLQRRWKGKRLQQLRKARLRQDLDLLVAWPRPNRELFVLRLCIRYVPEKKSWTWLLTNLPSTSFDADTVANLYRLRWQIEHVFKDWKSYANLHGFQTQHPRIVEGLIWASLCAALLKRSLAHWAQLSVRSLAVSTRIAAMAGPQLLPLLATWATTGFPSHLLHEILDFLVQNAGRTHPERDSRSPGRWLGLAPAAVRC
jgi:hypothetical protein